MAGAKGKTPERLLPLVSEGDAKDGDSPDEADAVQPEQICKVEIVSMRPGAAVWLQSGQVLRAGMVCEVGQVEARYLLQMGLARVVGEA